MLCHLLLLRPVSREAANAETVAGLDRRVASLSIREQERVPALPGSFPLELVLKVQRQSVAGGIRAFANNEMKCQCLGSEYTGNL